MNHTALNGLIAIAKRAAQRRKQHPSTGHLLLALMRQDRDASELLSQRGLREMDLISALKLAEQEPSSAMEVALERAERLARQLGHEEAGPLHLLAAIVREPRSVGHRCLERTGTGAARVRREVMSALGSAEAEGLAESVGLERRGHARPFVPPVPRTQGTRLAGVRGDEPRPTRAITPPLGRAGAARRNALRVLPPKGASKSLTPSSSPSPASNPAPSVDPAELAETSAAEASSAPVSGAPTSSPPTSRGAHKGSGRVMGQNRSLRAREPEVSLSPFALDPRRTPLLCSLGRNLSELAHDGKIDPVVGRAAEIEKILDILARRRANNPVLVGPPGVGKTAIVEGLALRMVAASRKAAQAAEASGLPPEPPPILVELSAGALVSGTGVRGALAEKLAQLKEEVARSEGQILLFLDEIHALVGGEGPDDLANELKAALARGELACVGATTEAEHRRCFERDPALARRFTRVEIAEPTPQDAIAILRGLLPSYEKHHAVAYEPRAVRSAVELSVRFLPERCLPDKAIAILDLAAARARRRGLSVVDLPEVAKVISEEAMVPLDRLLMRDADRLLSLEAHLRARVIGQEEPLARIADALRKGAAGFRGRRPLGTFLFLGPTGVGKTETAKAISDLLFPGAGMTRFDMSELSEPHSVARLLGAPPGYVGHDSGGQLTEAVRRRPYQLILLDEIEKAHPEVLLSLLPLLDEGRLTDGRGRTVDFTNTVIVMTSNLGAQARRSAPRVGFGARASEGDKSDREAAREAVLGAARRALPPELFNRIDEPLYFAALGREEVARIAAGLLEKVAEIMREEHKVGLDVEPSAIEALVAAGGYDAELGARPMRRVIGRLVEAPLASMVLAGEIGRGRTVLVRGEGARVLLEALPVHAAAE